MINLPSEGVEPVKITKMPDHHGCGPPFGSPTLRVSKDLMESGEDSVKLGPVVAPPAGGLSGTAGSADAVLGVIRVPSAPSADYVGLLLPLAHGGRTL